MRRQLVLGCCLLFLLGPSRGRAACEMRPDMPPAVPTVLEAVLAPERAAELAKQWGDYVERHPDVAIGYVYLWRARTRVAASGFQEGGKLLGKARELDPECPFVLTESSRFLLNTGKMEEARQLAQRALELAPDSNGPRFALLWAAVSDGDEAETRTQLQALIREGAFPSPVLDFAFNMLACTEPGATLFTNGDNDSAPAWALQAAFGVRPDVRVVDLSMLGVTKYAKAALASPMAGRAPFTLAEIEELQTRPRAAQQMPYVAVLEELTQRIANGVWTAPVYVATTVARSSPPASCVQRMQVVGLVYEVRREPIATSTDNSPAIDVPRTDSLLTQVFRLESATDFGYAWSNGSLASILTGSYVGVYMRCARVYAAAGDLEGVRRMLRGAIALLRFHAEMRHSGERDLLAELVSYWKNVDPSNPEVDQIQRSIAR
jgi:hypothetical protein